MKKVSIVIPVYNAASTLDRCLGSIFAQTYPDFEIIAVNDESKDESLSILQSYAQKDSRLSCYSIAHGGVSKARNFGLERATGEYLQFVDADDDLDERFLEKMIYLLESTSSDLAVCRFHHPFFKTYVENRTYDFSKPEELMALYQDCYGVVMPWNRLWRRECFTVPFDEEVHFSEDELGNLANLPNVKKAVSTNEYLYHYFFAKKEENAKEESCVNNIINSEAFWNNKTSFYYLGGRLVPKRKAIIERAIAEGKFPKECTDMPYYRLIDYCFWQMPAYIGMGIPEEGLAIENYHIFTEPDFIEGYRLREKYGFRLKPMTDSETKALAEKFTSVCYKIYREKGADENFKVAYAFISAFLKLFAEKIGTLDPVSFNAQKLLDLENNSTPEAIYVNSLL